MLARWAPSGSRSMALVGAGGLILLGASLWLITDATPFPGLWTLLPVGAAVLLLLAGSQPDNPVSKVLSARPMVRVGDWSYSIYLWHWPFIVFASLLWPGKPFAIVLAALASFIPALASYRWVEQPIRDRTITGRRQWATLLALVMVPPLLLGGLVALTGKYVWPIGMSALSRSAQQLQSHAGQECRWERPFGDAYPEPCAWNQGASGRPVYLVGDSNAGHFVEGLVDATKAAGRPLAAQTSAGCPVLDPSLQGLESGVDAACLTWIDRTLAWVEEQPPGTVVLANSDQYWTSPDGPGRADGGTEPPSPSAGVTAMGTALSSTIERLKAAGHEVVIVQTVPHFAGDYPWNAAECTLFATLNGACTQEMPLQYALDRSAQVRSSVAAVASATGVELLDFAADLCPESTCEAIRDGFPVYRDASHISVDMSHALSPEFLAILTAEAERLN